MLLNFRQMFLYYKSTRDTSSKKVTIIKKKKDYEKLLSYFGHFTNFNFFIAWRFQSVNSCARWNDEFFYSPLLPSDYVCFYYFYFVRFYNIYIQSRNHDTFSYLVSLVYLYAFTETHQLFFFLPSFHHSWFGSLGISLGIFNLYSGPLP